jgi:hypothetical protein
MKASASARKWLLVVWLVGLAALVFAVYGPALHSGITNAQYGDDVSLIALAGRPHLNWLWRETALPLTSIHLYRPASMYSFALDHVLWGTDPFGYHLTNLLLHLVAALLVAGLVWRLTGSKVPGMMAGTLMAVLPVVEPAVWISGRQDLICAIFYLASALAFREWGRGKGNRWLALSVLSLALSLWAKEPATTGPLVLAMFALLGYCRSVGWKRLVVAFAIIAAVEGLYLFMRSRALPLDTSSVFYLHHSPKMWHHYAWLLSRPLADLASQLRLGGELPVVTLYWRTMAGQLPDLNLLWAAFGVVLTLASAALLLWKCLRPAVAFFFWKAVVILPALALIYEGERYLYLPMIGAVALVALTCWQVLALARAKWKTPMGYVGLLPFLVAFWFYLDQTLAKVAQWCVRPWM